MLPAPDTRPTFSFNCGFPQGSGTYQTPGGQLGVCSMESLNGFAGTVDISFPANVPPGAFVLVPPQYQATLAPGESWSSMMHASFSDMTPGFYELNFTAASNGETKTSTIIFTLVEGPPAE